MPLSLRMAAEQQPITLDMRLYSGAGISGSFGIWPEELPTGIKLVDSLQLEPSLAFQYLPQQPPGEYSLVVRAAWDGPIDVFYAVSFRLDEEPSALNIPQRPTAAVAFEELFSDPGQYSGSEILLDGFYFHGWETTVLSERMEYTGRAAGHLWPRGRMVWIENNLIMTEVYDQLYQQEMIGPLERYGKLRIRGRFEHGGRYGHVGGFTAQIVPSEVELLPWSPGLLQPYFSITDLKYRLMEQFGGVLVAEPVIVPDDVRREQARSAFATIQTNEEEFQASGPAWSGGQV